MDSPIGQTVLKPHLAHHFEPSDPHKTPYREEDIVPETNIRPIPSPFTPHPFVIINLNLLPPVNYQTKEF